MDTVGNARSIVKSFGSTVSPAGTAVGLVTHVVDNIIALGPLDTRVEVGWEVNIGN